MKLEDTEVDEVPFTNAEVLSDDPEALAQLDGQRLPVPVLRSPDPGLYRCPNCTAARTTLEMARDGNQCESATGQCNAM